MKEVVRRQRNIATWVGGLIRQRPGVEKTFNSRTRSDQLLVSHITIPQHGIYTAFFADFTIVSNTAPPPPNDVLQEGWTSTTLCYPVHHHFWFCPNLIGPGLSAHSQPSRSWCHYHLLRYSSSAGESCECIQKPICIQTPSNFDMDRPRRKTSKKTKPTFLPSFTQSLDCGDLLRFGRKHDMWGEGGLAVEGPSLVLRSCFPVFLHSLYTDSCNP